MYTFRSDMSHRNPVFYVESHTPSWFDKIFNRRKYKNGALHHQLLQKKYEKPSISASTTATNLSDYQSNSTIFKARMATLEENLRLSQPELECLNPKDESPIKLNIDKEIDNEDCSNTKATNRLGLCRQLIAATAVSWVSMIIGYATAYTSPSEPSLRRDLNITEMEFSWIGSLMPLGALGGGMLGGPMIEYIGRKWTLLATDILFLIAWVVNYFATHYHYLYASRVIAGCSVGIASLTLPVYLGETIQPEVRGTLGLLPTAFGNIGILACYLLGNVLDWKNLAGVAALLPWPFLAIFIWIIPETPRYYISKDKPEQSKKSLEWLRGSSQNIDKEFNDLLRSQKESKNDNMSDLFTRGNVKLLFIALGLMFFQQFSGINAIIFYTSKIFKDAGSSMDATLSITIIGVVNFVSTFIATVLIDRLGRKILLYISSVSMAITLALLGGYFYANARLDVDLSYLSWAPLVCLVIYVLGFSLGFGPIPWLMMGEILPAKIRGPAASVSTAFNWSCTFIVTKTFHLMVESIGIYGTFWVFFGIVCFGLVFTIFFVPETRGQSLEDIERMLAGVKVRRMSSAANLKPMPSTF